MDIMGKPTPNGDVEKSRPLRVIIAGAGIGGLSAAIALRQAGHKVDIFESSRFATETGAAIHLPPNVNGLLRRFGMIPENHGAVKCEWVSEYKHNGEQVFMRDTSSINTTFPHPWQLIHRVDLHSALKELATSASGPGEPVIIHLASRVTSADLEAPSITLENGETHVGDLLLGADGIRSTIRNRLFGEQKEAQSADTNVFRFLLSSKKIREDPKTAHFVKTPGHLQVHFGVERRIVIYPCRDNEELNFVCMHPDQESEASSQSWNQEASKDVLLECYKTFPEDMRALLSKADPQGIKLWKLLDFEEFGRGSWVRGNVALLGDAAHPFLPHQGQGGAQAIEDGVALGALLPLGTLVSDINRRLQLYTEARYDRATMIQNFTRAAASKDTKGKNGNEILDPMKFTANNFDHDAFHYAAGILRRELSRSALYRRMPVSFGPTRSPRQNLEGRAAGPDSSTNKTVYMTFKTHKSYLSSLLPSSEFSIDAPGGWTTATFSLSKLGNLEWLGGRGYSHFGFYIHNVVKKATGAAEKGAVGEGEPEVKGDFLPVLFENMADPIITGREELGFAKVFATLQEETTPDGAYQLHAGWEGTNFCSMKVTGIQQTSDVVTYNAQPVISQRVFPSTKKNGQADIEYTTIAAPPASKEQHWRAEHADICFTELVGQEFEVAFPTLANIISCLREIKIGDIVETGMRLKG